MASRYLTDLILMQLTIKPYKLFGLIEY